MPPVLLADIGSFLILLLFVAISAASAWLQKRRQGQEESDTLPPFPMPRTGPHAPGQGPPRTDEPQPRSRTSTWEEELRRLLEGDQPTPPPRPRATPVPTAAPAQPARRPVPTVIAKPSRVFRLRTRHAEPPVVPPPPPLPRPILESPSLMPPASRFARSAAAHARASGLHDAIAERMRRIRIKSSTTTHKLGPAHVLHATLSPEIVSARNLLRTPQSARQAIIASVILGTPKSLE